MKLLLWSLCLFPFSVPALVADDSSGGDALQLTLPPAVYAVPGVETSIYFDNIIVAQNSDVYQFRVTCDVGQSEDRRWTVTPKSSDVGTYNLVVDVQSRDGQLLASQSTMLQVVPQPAAIDDGKTVNLLIIGDSLTHATAYPNEVARLLSLPGHPNWKMLGTHKPASAAAGVAHEGYGGWTWQRFVTKYEPDPDGTYRKRSSPFVFLNDDGNPHLDVARYFEESCSGQRPDYVVLMLGINDCFGAPPDNVAGMDARIDAMFVYADRLLDAIRQAAPAAQVGICMTTPPNSRQAAFEANYQDRYSRWGWKRIQHRLVQRQLAYVAAKSDAPISVIPTQLDLDPGDGYPVNNGVHPNQVGYKQIGATIYSWLMWRMSKPVRSSLPPAPENTDVFLLPYFLNNGETGVYFAYSHDGYHFAWMNQGKVVMPAPLWGDESLTRDPSIRYHDGLFHMVWTTSWNSRSIGYASSKDLLNWSAPTRVDVWGDRQDVKNTWAPELHWDPAEQEFLVLFSTTTLDELNDNDGSVDPHGHDHRTYAVRTKEFRTWSEPSLFFSPQDPEYGVIDPYIAHDDRNTSDPADDRWVMVIKNEMSAAQGGKNLRLTFSRKMQGPYDTRLSPPVVGAGTEIVNQMGEGPSLFKRSGRWFLYWDAPGSQHSYCLATSPDLKTWTDRSSDLLLPAEHMRHGTVLMVPYAVVADSLPAPGGP